MSEGAKVRHSVKVAVHVVLEREGPAPTGEATRHVFMIRRQNTGFQDGRWSLPSGHLEAGETVLEAAVREVAEEAGTQVLTRDLTLHAVVHARSPGHEYLHVFFRTARFEGEPFNAEPSKGSEVAWLPLASLPTDTIVYERRALEAPQGSVLTVGYDD